VSALDVVGWAFAAIVVGLAAFVLVAVAALALLLLRSPDDEW
jgi:hypothetical protein